MDHYDKAASLIPMAILIASFTGSAHCIGMCGGLVISCTKSKMQWIGYQIGRLLGYLFLGAIAGFLGEKVFSFSEFSGFEELGLTEILSWASTFFISSVFIVMAIQILRGRPPHLNFIPPKPLAKLYQKFGSYPFILGGLSALLPCGWLHAFVFSAVATQSVLKGIVVLFFFWLGNLPALGLAPFITQKVLGSLSLKSPRVTALLFVSAGVLSLGLKIVPQFFLEIPCH